jgi:hypothetical protein
MKLRVLVDLPPQVVCDSDPERWAAFRAALPGNRLRRSAGPGMDRWRSKVPLKVKAPSVTGAAEIGVQLVQAAAEPVWGLGVDTPGTCSVRRAGIRALFTRRDERHVCCYPMPWHGWPGGGTAGDREPCRPSPSMFPPAAAALDDPHDPRTPNP